MVRVACVLFVYCLLFAILYINQSSTAGVLFQWMSFVSSPDGKEAAL